MNSPHCDLPRLNGVALCPLALSLLMACGLAQAADAAADVTDLDTLHVRAKRQVTEGSGSYQAGATNAAIGLDMDVRRTPQSVTIVTRQQIEDQQIESFDDLMASTTGITTSSLDNAGRTTFRARGFDISNFKIDGMQVNGASSFSGAGSSFNLDLYDHVQIVRGANGLLGGTGDPSATIYLERKRPTREFGAAAALTTGSWNKRRAMGDLNVPVTADGRVRARVVASGEDSDTFREREDVKRYAGLFNLDADLTDSTLLNVGIQREHTRNGGASWGSNVPIWYADGTRTRLSRKTNPVADWSVAKRTATTWFANLDQGLPADWMLHAGYSHTQNEAYTNVGVAKINNAARRVGGYAGFWTQAGAGAYLNAFHADYSGQRDNVDISAKGPVLLFGREHELMVGFNGYRDELTQYSFSNALGNCYLAGVTPYSGCQWRAAGLPISNIWTWDGSYAELIAYRTHARTVTTVDSYGGYLAGRFSLADPLTLVLGTRLSNYKTSTDTYTKANAVTRGAATGTYQELTPYAGLLWDIGGDLTAYASYTSIFTPQGNVRDANDALLDPLTGDSYEAGIKGEFFNKALDVSLAVFRNKQNNVAESTGTYNDSTGNLIYQAVDGVRSKGVELEASGQIGTSWNVYAGYTYLETEGLSYRQDPRNLLRVFTTYTLPGRWNRLTLGGGVSVQDGTEWSTNPGRPLGGGSYDASNLKLGGYTLLNLMGRYRFSDRLELTVNLSNVTDKVYYTQYGFYDGLIYGEPRAVGATLRMRF